MQIRKAESEGDFLEAKKLILEYVSSLGLDLSFQKFDDEITRFPGEYSSPNGCILLALDNDAVVGCVAMRKLSSSACEMKRLYVRPQFRRKRIGKILALAIIEQARKAHYQKMRLDTLESMKEATTLYRSLGFNNIEPYRYNPIKNALFMELLL